MKTSINSFLANNGLLIATNPCVSPDFCLDWAALRTKLQSSGEITSILNSSFTTADGEWTLMEDPATGDCAWRLHGHSSPSALNLLEHCLALSADCVVFPATYANLLRLKNLVQTHDPDSTIFPTAGGTLGQGTLGIGARFTTLHWPAVDWVMDALDLSLTANQNSIPRELVYDVDAMLAGRLDTVPFPFIGGEVPEGHQGQSVEGMAHGCVLAKLRSGFHRRRIPWSFNADHQPVGGKFDDREEELVRGCLLASYITFDLSPELTTGTRARFEDIPADVFHAVSGRIKAAGLALAPEDLRSLLCQVWPAMQKMKRRDDCYTVARAEAFATETGRTYLRELSIDELPGLTSPETTAVMLALCEALGMRIHFVAPAFGFQKNMPYGDDAALRRLIEQQWQVCRAFDAGIGFHSGSGKSASNYRIMGEVTGGRLEIKTSGRYTYEMGRALHASSDPYDQALWKDWHRFTVELALAGAFSALDAERQMARTFILNAVSLHRGEAETGEIFESPEATRATVEALPAHPDNMFWFEYNFLYVLAAGGLAEKQALGDHRPEGYRQRARFYSISPGARLQYGKNVAAYLLFLAEQTGLAAAERCTVARDRLASLDHPDQLLSLKA